MNNNISFYEIVSFAKMFSYAFAIDRNIPVTQHEQEAAIELLKKVSDRRADWTQEQKEIYKIMADITKETLKG